MTLGKIQDMDENKSRSVNYFEIVKIDVLEARDYVDRVLDVNIVKAWRPVPPTPFLMYDLDVLTELFYARTAANK